MFIEVRKDGKRRLVNVAWISGVSESSGCIDIGNGEEWVSCDESCEEIVWKIAEGERVVALEEPKKATRDTERTGPLRPGF